MRRHVSRGVLSLCLVVLSVSVGATQVSAAPQGSIAIALEGKNSLRDWWTTLLREIGVLPTPSEGCIPSEIQVNDCGIQDPQ